MGQLNLPHGTDRHFVGREVSVLVCDEPTDRLAIAIHVALRRAVKCKLVISSTNAALTEGYFPRTAVVAYIATSEYTGNVRRSVETQLRLYNLVSIA